MSPRSHCPANAVMLRHMNIVKRRQCRKQAGFTTIVGCVQWPHGPHPLLVTRLLIPFWWLAGIPRNGITLGRESTPGGNAGLAECGSLQLEWYTLSARTQKKVYGQKALRVFSSIHKAHPQQVNQHRVT